MQGNQQTERRIDFAGLTSFNEQHVPEDVFGHGSSMRWWATERSSDETNPEVPDTSFNTAIDRLPRATTVEAGWRHPVSGKWVPTGKHNALVNPEKVEQLTDTEATAEEIRESNGLDESVDVVSGDDALYYIPTDDYTVINPSQFLRPLAEVIRDEDLGDSVFGEFRLSRGGGRVSADIFFDGKHVEAPELDEDRKPIVVGFQVDWDFFGGTSVRAQGMGMDWECVNAIRAITDKLTVKHTGNVEERVDWHAKWRSLLEEIDLKVDQLSRMIAEATEETLDVSDLPDDFAEDYDSILEAFYAFSGLPDYLAHHAAQNARAEAADPFEPNFWELHRGATYAVSHHANGDVGVGGSIEQYNGTANDMLMNPPRVREQVEGAYTEWAAEDEESLEEEGGGVARIWTDDESVAAKKEKFEEREQEIRSLLANEAD